MGNYIITNRIDLSESVAYCAVDETVGNMKFMLSLCCNVTDHVLWTIFHSNNLMLHALPLPQLIYIYLLWWKCLYVLANSTIQYVLIQLITRVANDICNHVITQYISIYSYHHPCIEFVFIIIPA